MFLVNVLLVIFVFVIYVMFKGGMKQFILVVVVVFVLYGICVVVVGFGMILIDMVVLLIYILEDVWKMVMLCMFVGCGGELSEVVFVVVFFVSDDVFYIMGQIIYLDGGWLVLNYMVLVQVKQVVVLCLLFIVWFDWVIEYVCDVGDGDGVLDVLFVMGMMFVFDVNCVVYFVVMLIL